VVGGSGNDYLSDGPLRDSSIDELFGGSGTDVLTPFNKPAAKDLVSCGDGNDWAIVDRKDVGARDCEKVGGSGLLDATPHSFWDGLPNFF